MPWLSSFKVTVNLQGCLQSNGCSLRSKRSRTSRMKSDRAKELFRIRAARKMGREQFGRARSEARAKMWNWRSDLFLSLHFSRGPNAKELFRAVRFHSVRTGTLATQAKRMSRLNLVSRVSGEPSWSLLAISSRLHRRYLNPISN